MSKKGKLTVDPKEKNKMDKKHEGGETGWEQMSSGPASDTIVASGEFHWTETGNPGYCFWMNIGGTWTRICV